MKKNHKKKLILSLITALFLGFSKIARADLADPLMQEFSGFYAVVLGFVLSTAIEIFIAYFFLFRKNLKGVLAVLVANLISYPLLFCWMAFTQKIFILGYYYGVRPIPIINSSTSLLIGEIFIIVLEMAVLKLILRDKITYLRAFLVSIILNMSSLVIGHVFLIMSFPLSFWMHILGPGIVGPPF